MQASGVETCTGSAPRIPMGRDKLISMMALSIRCAAQPWPRLGAGIAQLTASRQSGRPRAAMAACPPARGAPLPPLPLPARSWAAGCRASGTRGGAARHRLAAVGSRLPLVEGSGVGVFLLKAPMRAVLETVAKTIHMHILV